MSSCWCSGFKHTVQSVLTAESLTDFEIPNEEEILHTASESRSSPQWFFFFPTVSYILTGNWRGRAAGRRTNPSSLNGYALAISKMHNKPTVHTVALLINTNVYTLCFYPSKKGLVNSMLRQCNQSRLVILPFTGRKSIRWLTVGLNWL